MSEYTAAEQERLREPLAFELGGQTWHTRRRVPFALIANLALAMDSGGLGVLSAFAELVIQAVKRSERGAFRELVMGLPEDEDEDESGRTVEMRDLMEVAQKIAEYVTGSPFVSVSGSPDSQSGNGGKSLVPAGFGATTSPPHRRVKL